MNTESIERTSILCFVIFIHFFLIQWNDLHRLSMAALDPVIMIDMWR